MYKYSITDGYTLVIPESIIHHLFSFRQSRSNPSESGGILLGRLVGNEIVLSNLSCPNAQDKQGLNYFIRDKNQAQKIINEAFQLSHRKEIYIGEWHSHNEANPSPSFTDKDQIKQAYKKSKLHFHFLIMIILGNQDSLGNIWVGYQDNTKLYGCKLVS